MSLGGPGRHPPPKGSKIEDPQSLRSKPSDSKPTKSNSNTGRRRQRPAVIATLIVSTGSAIGAEIPFPNNLVKIMNGSTSCFYSYTQTGSEILGPAPAFSKALLLRVDHLSTKILKKLDGWAFISGIAFAVCFKV